MGTTLSDGTIEELRQSLRGELLTPADAAYDDARTVWNGMIDRLPKLIVRCQGVADVLAAIQFARSENLEVAVRGGGHSLPGFSTTDGGILIDLRLMNAVRVDPASRRVVVEAGATWHELDHETQAFGLAVTGGLVSSTGVAGFTLGGGIGWLMRKYGLACDNLISADVVTADGQLVHASDSENPELLWGLRGGGGNFGVVTAFEFALQRVGPIVLAGPIFFPGDQAREILAGWRDWTTTAPDEITTLANLLTAPPLPFLPEAVHGTKVVLVAAAYAGDQEDGAAIVAPLRRLGDPIADLLGPMPYAVAQSLVDPLFGPGARNYFTAAYLRELPDQAIDRLVAFHGPSSSPLSEIHVHQLGGAVARVPADASAYANRDAEYAVNIVARWTDASTDEAQRAWARDLYAAIEPFATDGAYVNFLGSGDEAIRTVYPPETYERLSRLKGRWDPTNLFRLNQNVLPPSKVVA
jgi:FAD/FMN-containing dehydrogenase